MGNDIDPHRGVGDKGHAALVGVEIVGQFGACRQHQLGPASDKGTGVFFKFSLPTLIDLKHRSRACAKRAIVK